jgi:hypothetical protein
LGAAGGFAAALALGAGLAAAFGAALGAALGAGFGLPAGFAGLAGRATVRLVDFAAVCFCAAGFAGLGFAAAFAGVDFAAGFGFAFTGAFVAIWLLLRDPRGGPFGSNGGDESRDKGWQTCVPLIRFRKALMQLIRP